jgi:hypothetical protein
MPYEDLLVALRKQPFEPFRIYLTDGKVYDVRHPELVLPGRRSFIVGFTGKGYDDLVYDRYETVALVHVVRFEPMVASQG